jgi:hypothetical protein
MNYILKCNETQLRVINIALEEYFRLRLGQMGDLAEDLAMLQYQKLSAEERHERFDEILQIRDHAKICLDAAYRVAVDDRHAFVLPAIGKTPYGLICEDIWQVIRHQLWLDEDGPTKMPWSTAGREPLLMSDEPLPQVWREDGDSATK